MAMQKSSISVVVVKGEFLALYRLGFPFPALATMQDVGLQLCDASWDVRKSATGLSVSKFFGKLLWLVKSSLDLLIR